MKYNLTSYQKEFLSLLINGIRNNGWGETFLDVSAGGIYKLLASPSNANIQVNSISDMDIITSNGLTIMDFTRSGTKKFTITQAAYDAVDNDFLILDELTQPAIGVQVVGNVSGGNVQGIGYADNSQIQQIVDDPEKLKGEIEKLTTELLQSIKKDISSNHLKDYKKITEELKAEFQKEKYEENKFRKIIGSLSFINDTAASFQLILKVMPYISIIVQYVEKFLIK